MPFKDLKIWHIASDELDCVGTWAASNRDLTCREKFFKKQLGVQPRELVTQFKHIHNIY